ncbi:MAG: redox-sensing transcriptional repressor Rex [Chloroflexi bacterium]|nr:redox-sensing transcriptional repressor Rex [Chloroflexota bacterium]
MAEQVPRVVVSRLPLYYRVLSLFEEEKKAVVSSQALGARLQLTPAQIRKDLSYFGRFGKQGKGYNVKRLLQELKKILGLDREWGMAVVGVGKLGRALLGYGAFPAQGFRIVAAFDNDPAKVGRKLGNVTVQEISELPSTLAGKRIHIGIVSVPPSEAQAVVNQLISYGVRAILNYAPSHTQVPDGIQLRDVDPVMALQGMTFYLKNAQR